MEKNKNNLKKLRNEFGLSVREIDEIVGLNYSMYSRLELGKQRLISSQIELLTNFFQVTSDYLLGLSNVGIKCIAPAKEEIIISEEEFNKYNNSIYLTCKRKRSISSNGYQKIMNDRKNNLIPANEAQKKIENLKSVILFWQNASRNKDNNIKILELKNEALQSCNDLLAETKEKLVEEIRALEQERDELECSVRVFSRMITNKE